MAVAGISLRLMAARDLPARSPRSKIRWTGAIDRPPDLGGAPSEASIDRVRDAVQPEVVPISDRQASLDGPAAPGSVGAKAAARIVADESTWREAPPLAADATHTNRVHATRWQSNQRTALEVKAATADNCHVIGIALRRINVRLRFGGRTVHDGFLMPGMLVVNEPAAIADGLLRGPTDVLHLYVPNAILSECGGHFDLRSAAALPPGARSARDPAIERLGMALLQADEFGSAFGRLYADSIGIAIVTRLLDTAQKPPKATRPRTSGLSAWRLKRALDYIDGNLAEPIRLADLAAAAGLTRMHFAAQFRAATGLRPHEYLLRRRIEHAQQMLRHSDEPISQVALQVGFQTQAHFTSIFTRFVGQPPHAWRTRRGAGADPGR